MITQFRTWFVDRSLREKRLLIGMAALAALTLVWAGIIRPVTDSLSSARSRHADAVIRLGETRTRLDAVREAQHDRPAPVVGGLDAVVRARAEEAGFTLASATPQGADRLQLSIASAKPGALVGWISDLESSGLLVDTLAMTSNGDQTVSAQLTIKARGL